MAIDAPREHGQLIKIETDRRLGHEWDEWDGTPLDNGGDFRSPARLYFAFTAVGFAIVAALLAAGVYLLAPRLGALFGSGVSATLYYSIGGGLVLGLVWLGLIAAAVYSGRAVLPERLAERGLLLKTLNLAWRTGELFGVKRDWTGHASVAVYDRLALARERSLSPDELLILVPRCLSRESLDGVLAIAKRHGVSAFVATRGQLARRVIKERRPKAVVAVACERDMVSRIARCGRAGAGARAHHDAPERAV